VGRPPRRLGLYLIIVLALLLVLLGTERFWLTGLGWYLVKADPPAKADIIVVLAGDYFGNRILAAGDLVRQGFAPKALVSGPAHFYGHYESDYAIPFAVQMGYPAPYFVAFPNDGMSTASEAEAVIGELRKLRVHNVEIVTSNFHTRRAGHAYRSRAKDLEFHVVAAPDPYFTPNGWWTNREGRKEFLMEWMKTIATWFGM